MSVVLPAGPGAARESAILDLARQGRIPSFVTAWVQLPVAAAGHTGTLYVSPDYFAVGSDNDFVRVPMGPHTAEAIGDLLSARLPTRKIVNDIQTAAPCKLAAKPWGPPYDASMMATDRFVAHNATVEQQRQQSGCSLGTLTSGHKKDVVVTPSMDGEHVCIYGWFASSSVSSAIQGPQPNCKSHEVTYADYSHGIRFVYNMMLVDGQQRRVDDVMRDPVLHALVSDAGPFMRTRYIDSVAYEGNVPVGGAPSLGTGLAIAGLALGGVAYMFADIRWGLTEKLLTMLRGGR